MIDLFFQLQDYNSDMTTADGNTCNQNSQCMNTVLQNMNGNRKITKITKKLLKAKLITSKQVPSLLFLQRYAQPHNFCTEHFKFSNLISLLHSLCLLVIYFPELSISILNVGILLLLKLIST